MVPSVSLQSTHSFAPSASLSIWLLQPQVIGSSITPLQFSSIPLLQISATGETVCWQVSVPEGHARTPVAHAPGTPVAQLCPCCGNVSSVALSQSLSIPSQTSPDGVP